MVSCTQLGQLVLRPDSNSYHCGVFSSLVLFSWWYENRIPVSSEFSSSCCLGACFSAPLFGLSSWPLWAMMQPFRNACHRSGNQAGRWRTGAGEPVANPEPRIDSRVSAETFLSPLPACLSGSQLSHYSEAPKNSPSTFPAVTFFHGSPDSGSNGHSLSRQARPSLPQEVTYPTEECLWHSSTYCVKLNLWIWAPPPPSLISICSTFAPFVSASLPSCSGVTSNSQANEQSVAEDA